MKEGHMEIKAQKSDKLGKDSTVTKVFYTIAVLNILVNYVAMMFHSLGMWTPG